MLTSQTPWQVKAILQLPHLQNEVGLQPLSPAVKYVDVSDISPIDPRKSWCKANPSMCTWRGGTSLGLIPSCLGGGD